MTFNEGPNYERSETVFETPVAQTVVHQQVPGDYVVAAPLATSRVRRAYSSHFEPDALIAALVGLALLLVGLVAAVRAGMEGAMSDPVVEVLGFRHTATLGLIEVALGLCLLIAGTTRSRSGAMFFGAVLGVAGFVAAVQSTSFEESLAIESSLGWLAVLAGLLVVLTAMMLPRSAKHSTVVENV